MEPFRPIVDRKVLELVQADDVIQRTDTLERFDPFGKARLLIILHRGPVLGDLVLNDDGGGRREQGVPPVWSP